MIQPACDTTTEVTSPDFANVCQIHLQAWFSQTSVTVTVDNSRLFTGYVSTGAILGYATILPVQVTKGTHGLNVTAYNSLSSPASKDTTFTVADSLYIGVNYDSTTSQIRYYFTRRPFLYD